MFLFPPVGYPTTYGRNIAKGYRFAGSLWEEHLVIDNQRLLMQFGILFVVGVLLAISLQDKNSRDAENSANKDRQQT